jgi:VIT1/CCC1 family predicted Fe2+/Mn2+ transporter
MSYLRDWIYGGIDGSVTTFAVVSGVAGARLAPEIILILGAANLIADGFSMAASNYSATRAEQQEYAAYRHMEERHVALDPEGEREEIRQILAKKGLSGRDLEHVVTTISSNRDRWIDFMMSEEHGLPSQMRSASLAAVATFSAFALCGLLPLLPFALGMTNAFSVSTGVTMAVFFAIGSAKSRWLVVSWSRAGLETLAIGAAAAALAYAAGTFIGRLGSVT